jgi:preprotein translocase subunit SecG
MYHFILIIHIFAAVCLIALVLVQQGRGAAMGSSFGSGASQTVFGSRGSGSILLKITIGFLLLFFATSIAMNNMASHAVNRSQPIPVPVSTTDIPSAPPVTTNTQPQQQPQSQPSPQPQQQQQPGKSN